LEIDLLPLGVNVILSVSPKMSSKAMKLETGLEKGLIHRERRRLLSLPYRYGCECKSLMHGRIFILTLVEAMACLQL